MAHPRPRLPFRLAVLAAPLLVLAASPVGASTMAMAPARAAPVSDPDTLKGLPASHDELVFRGENSGGTWPVYLSRTEAARSTTFQLGLLNTVSLLPERSNLRLAINGRVLANIQIRSPEKMSALPIRIPAGVLVPGFNAVQISVTMAHRVDCSIKATYELWTLLNPTQTGFLVPAQAAAVPRTLDDLAAETPSEDGTTHIHLRVPADADSDLLSQGANFISALVVRSHLIRPVVDIGTEPGSGAGLDVILGTDEDADKAATLRPGIALRRDETSRRMVIATPDGDVAGLAGIGSQAPRSSGTSQGSQAFNNMSGVGVESAQRLSFAELGLHGEAFAGRRSVTELGVTFPDDFYPGSYAKAAIYVDGTRAAGLNPNATLVFRVNGTLVSSLPLGPSSPDRLDHAMVELPLQFFRPGFNAIEIEGLMPTAADEQCDTSASPTGTRLTIADTSELVIPHFARMQTSPQIVGTLRFEDDPATEPTDVYVTSNNPALTSAALTVAANMSARNRVAGRIRLSFDEPSRSDRSGIVVGTLGELPGLLADPLHKLIAPAADSSVSPTSVPDARPAQAPATDADAAAAVPAVADPAPAVVPPATMRLRAEDAVVSGRRWLRSNGFFFAGAPDDGPGLRYSDHSLLVADVLGSNTTIELAGIELPRFAKAPDNWVVFTGLTDAAVADGLSALVANGRWKDLNGEAVSYDPGSGQLQTAQPRSLTYVVPKSLIIGDLRPILGGMISSNITLSTLALLVLLILLGVTTFACLRFVGERSK